MLQAPLTPAAATSILSGFKSMQLCLADVFLPRTSPYQVALSVTLAGVVFLILLAGYCFWKQHRAKGRVTEGKECCGTERGSPEFRDGCQGASGPYHEERFE